MFRYFTRNIIGISAQYKYRESDGEIVWGWLDEVSITPSTVAEFEQTIRSGTWSHSFYYNLEVDDDDEDDTPRVRGDVTFTLHLTPRAVKKILRMLQRYPLEASSASPAALLQEEPHVQ